MVVLYSKALQEGISNVCKEICWLLSFDYFLVGWHASAVR